MSTPHSGPGRIRRLAAGISRWNNRRIGTSTLKAAYAQAARDVKRMDPAVRVAIGRAGIGKEDLKNLVQANTAAIYSPRAAQSAQQLNAWVSGQVQATTPEARRTFNPVKAVSNRITRWQDKRLGTATLKAAYAQARRDVKQMDPAVREAIGQSRIDKRELAAMSRMQVAAPVGAGIQQAAQQHHARAWAEAQARAQAAQARAAGPRHAAAPDSAGQRVANAVNTASRWAKAAKSYPVEKAKKFQADYAERRQNPVGRHAQPQAGQSGPQAQAQAQSGWTVQPIQPARAQSAQPLQATQQVPTQPLPATQAFPAETTQRIPAPSAEATQRIPVPSAEATQRIPVPSAEATQRIPVPSAETTQRIPAPSAETTQRTPAQGQAAQPQAQGPAGQTVQQRAAEAQTFHAGLNNNMPHVGATPAAASQETTQRIAGPGTEQAGSGRHSGSDPASKAFAGVAGPAGATKPGTAQSTGQGTAQGTGGKHAERVGNHRRPEGGTER